MKKKGEQNNNQLLIKHHNYKGVGKSWYLNESINSEKEKEKNIYKYLEYTINLYIKYSDLYKKINESISYHPYNNEFETDYFLVNKEYIDKIESIINFEEIIRKLKMNMDIESNRDNNKDLLLKNIKNILDNETINSLSELNKEKIEYTLKDRSLYRLKESYYRYKGLYYYNNSRILNKDICEHLKKIDPQINSIIKEIKCIFDKGKIIMFINSEIINIGHINENKEFIIDYLIRFNDNSYNTYALSNVFKNIQEKGYHFIEKFISKGYINFTFTNGKIAQATIYKLSEENKINSYDFNNINISKKLKTLLLISIEQNFDINNNNIHNKNNELTRVYLLNGIWLLKHKLNDIKLLFENNPEIKKIITQSNITDIRYDSTIFTFYEFIRKGNKSKNEFISNFILPRRMKVG